MAHVGLHRLPLGAGGPRIVRATGRVYALLTGAAPHHAALTCEVDGARWTIEVAPSPDDDLAGRGVVATGAGGARLAARWRVFRHEVRCRRDGVIPDLASDGRAAGCGKLRTDSAATPGQLDRVLRVRSVL